MAARRPAGGDPRPARPRRRRGRGERPRDPEATREAMLDAGRRLVADHSTGPVLGHLRITDLARPAGLTTGAFYHYWEDQEAYRAEVVDALLAAPRPVAADDLFGCADAPAGADAVDYAVRHAARRLATDPWHRLDLALWAHDDPRARTGLRDNAERTHRAWAGALVTLLAHLGRRPAAGWGLDRLTTSAAALGDGLRTLHLVDPDVVDLEGTRPWGPASTLALLLVLGTTEPGPPAGRVETGTGLTDEHTDTAPPAPATTGPEGRRRLVDLGVAAALERPAGDALEHVRADDVVVPLDLTIGAFYHHWSRQDDYRDDLVDALFDAGRYVDADAVAALAAGAADADDLTTVIREATTWYWSVAADHPDNRIQLGFLAADDPYLTGRIAEQVTALRAGWHAVLANALDAAGRHVRPPLDVDTVVTGLAAALDGFVLRHGLGVDDLGPDDDGWTAWGRTCLALVTAATARAGDGRDLPTLATAELG